MVIELLAPFEPKAWKRLAAAQRLASDGEELCVDLRVTAVLSLSAARSKRNVELTAPNRIDLISKYEGPNFRSGNAGGLE